MTRRGIVSLAMIVIGLALMAYSYLFGAAPWCNDAVACADPRLEWSPLIFVIGVILAFSSAVYYEVAKGKDE